MGISTPVTKLLCWSCGEKVPVKHGGGSCPLCGAMLSPISYDEAAKTLVEEKQAVIAEREELGRELEVQESRNAKWGVLRRLPILPSRRKLRNLERQMRAVEAKRDELLKRIARLASARYYSGDWFRATGMRLRRDAGDAIPHCPLASAGYNKLGEFYIDTCVRTSEQRGVYGEYLVFNTIAEAIERGDFGHARLLRALYIPDHTSILRNPYGGDYTEEIDALLVTSRAIFVIEVKNLTGRIEVLAGKGKAPYDVQVTAPYDGAATRRDSGPGQNNHHVRALRNVLDGEVDRRAIVNLTVYVDDGGFEMTAPQGLRGDYIATTSGGKHNVLHVIGQIEQGMKLRWADREVDELARAIDLEYSDVDGSKAEAHKRAIERNRRNPYSRSFGRGSGKGKGVGRGARDKELERMLREVRS